MIRAFRAAAVLAALPTFAHAEWFRATTRNFELFADAGEKPTRDLAVHFEEVRGFFAQASPVKPPGEVPLRVVVLPPDEFRNYSRISGAAAFFLSGPGHDYIVMKDVSPESYGIAVHEYMHFVTKHSGLRIPLWLSEGWADVYSSMRRVKDGMAVGDLIPGRVRTLETNRAAWFPFEQLTTVNAKSSIYNEGDRTGLFYAQSWALVHMLFLAPEYKENFGKFVMALHRGASASDACQTAFGRTSAQVQADLTTYFDRKKLFGTIFQTTLTPAETEPSVAAIDEFESKVRLADVQIANGRLDLARIEYERLEKAKPDRRDVQKSLGYLFWSIRDNVRAKQHMAKAFALGETDAQMCYTLALLQMASNESPQAIIASLERAVTTLPGYTDALLQLGVVSAVARQFQKSVDALMAIPAITSDKAFAVFNALAYGYLQTGDVDQAKAHLATATKYAKSEAEKKAAANLSNLVEARAASPFRPKPGEKLVRVEGMVKGLDCTQQAQKLLFAPTAGDMIPLDLPSPAAVEILRKGEGSLKLACGTSGEPFRAVVEYTPSSAVRQGSAGVLRTLQF